MNDNKPNAEVITQDLLADIFKGGSEPAEQPSSTEPTPAPIPTPEVIIPEEVVNTPPATEPAPEPTEEKPLVQNTDYSLRLQTAIKDGLIENFQITYNGEESYLEDISDLDEEAYNEIIKSWKSEQEKQVSEKYIPKEGLDEKTQKLIEISRSGGDITELIRENVTAIDHIVKLKETIDDEKVQINLVGYNLEQQGLKPKVIEAQIQALIEDGELETTANEILDSHLTRHHEAIETKRVEQNERITKEKDDLKNLKNTLKATYKSLGVPEDIHKLLIDNTTKLDADKISNTDKLYFEAIKDPAKLAEIAYFLNNPDQFKKWVSSKKVLEAKLGETKKMLSININNTKKPNVNKNSFESIVDEIMQK